MKEFRRVWSFICTPPDSKDGLRFVLMKRSAKVLLNANLWEVCTGSLETTDPTPESAARRNIKDETQLSPNDITLYRTGKVFQFKQQDTTWIIHTFAFLINDSNKKLVLDSEHVDHQFISISDLKNKKYDLTPALDLAIKRVLPGPLITEGLKKMRDDNDNGAEEMASAAIEILRTAIDSDDRKAATTATVWWNELRLAAWMLAKYGRPDMGPTIEGALLKALLDISEEIKRTSGVPCFPPEGIKDLELQLAKNEAKDGIERTKKARIGLMDSLADSFLQLVLQSESWKQASKDPTKSVKILTLSYSSSVLAVLKALIKKGANGTTIHLKILESRPRFDGVTLAKELFTADSVNLNRLMVDILPDAAVALAAKDADFVVLGSIKVSANGNVSNKIGSLPACILAKTMQPKCKVAVIATTDKIVPADDKDLIQEPKDYGPKILTAAYPSDTTAALAKANQGAQVRFRNPYFEWVPAKWVDAYVTERGLIHAAQRGKELKTYADAKLEMENKLFADL